MTVRVASVGDRPAGPDDVGPDEAGTVDRILDLHQQLAALADLAPAPLTNSLFSQLVELCCGGGNSDGSLHTRRWAA